MLVVDDNNAITLTRGDTAELELTLQTQDGETYDYSGDTVRFGVKRTALDTTEPVLVKEFEDGKILFTPEDTANMAFGDYVYDVEVQHETEDGTQVYTPIAAARFTLGYNVL